MTATIDEAAKTLGEFEALAQKTGEWDGADAVEFSNNGLAWSPIWMPTVERIESAGGPIRETITDPHPAFARARVYRKGVAHVDWQYVSWDESAPADEEWFELWMRRPVKLFGSYALRSAYRHTFRDVVGERRGPDEQLDGPTVDAAPVARDWAAEYRAATTVAALDDLRRAARAARENTLELQELWSARRAELAATDWEPTARTVSQTNYYAPAPELSADELARHHAFFGHEPKAPQDHQPPANRAARRAAARKGRR